MCNTRAAFVYQRLLVGPYVVVVALRTDNKTERLSYGRTLGVTRVFQHCPAYVRTFFFTRRSAFYFVYNLPVT